MFNFFPSLNMAHYNSTTILLTVYQDGAIYCSKKTFEEKGKWKKGKGKETSKLGIPSQAE